LLHRRAAEALRIDLAQTGREDLGRLVQIAQREQEAGRHVEVAVAFRDAGLELALAHVHLRRGGLVAADRHLDAALATDDEVCGDEDGPAGRRRIGRIYHESMRAQTSPGGHRPSPAYDERETDSAVRMAGWGRPGDALSIVDGHLHLDTPGFFAGSAMVRPGPGLLSGFMELEGASDKRVLAYARRWGVLELCQHHLPLGHPDVSLPGFLGQANARSFMPAGNCVQLWTEPIAIWRFWAGQARATANVGIRLRNGLTPDPGDVARLYDRAPWVEPLPTSVRGAWLQPLPAPPVTEPAIYLDAVEELRSHRRKAVADRPLTSSELRQIVDGVLEFWLEIARVGLRLTWIHGRPDVLLTGGLFGAIGSQLLMAITGSQGFALCGGCGAVHVPARPNDTQRRSYCFDCRAARVPQRIAQRGYEARRREAGADVSTG